MTTRHLKDGVNDGAFELDRRQLLSLSLTAAGTVAAGTLALGTAGCREAADTGHLAAPDPLHNDDPTDFAWREATLADLQQAMVDGKATAVSITQAYLDRIAEIDDQGPTLRAVIETNPDALEIAATLDEERAAGAVRGPLHGIPVLLKDNISTADRNTTTAGALVLKGSIAPDDAFVAAQLRQAGAVLLGKANLSEWANFRSTMSSSGWSARGGQCRNPYVLDRTPCGSSSGSAVAVAANLTAAAVGTETNGSVVCPSSTNGIVGLKPTVGLVSRRGIIPISSTQDTAGPMARTVRDVATLLGGMVGVDAGDSATADSAGKFHQDYTQFLDQGGDGTLDGVRIGVGRASFGFHPKVDELMERALDNLTQLGVELVDPIETPSWDDMGTSSYTVMLYEFKDGLEAYFATLGDKAPVRTMEELIAWNKEHADDSMPHFGQEILEAALEKQGLDTKEYKDALAKARRASRRDGLDKVLGEHKIDAIVAPTGGPAWLVDHVNGDHFGGGSSSPAAISGYPNITVPAGFVSKLPVGLSIFGAAWSEPTLLRIAYAYEQATKHRRPPEFIPTLGLG